MDQTESTIVNAVKEAILSLLRGEPPNKISVPEIARGDSLDGLCESVNELMKTFSEAHDFLAFLSKGTLEVDPPRRSFLISPFKQLHSNLRHLTWQTKQVATGDFSHRVDFLGEFSDAFNSMIDSLREKRLVELELHEAHSKLLEANTQIMDSIHYARTIQTAFLPNTQEITSALKDFCIIWKPKDVIGGDIYKFRSHQDGFLIAAIDCTGHGVPGAIMTMIAGSSFDRALEEVGHADPALILQKLNLLVKNSLNQHVSESPSDDGLDIGICLVNKSRRTLVFAGAKIGLFRVSDGQVHEIPGDRQSIGYKTSRLSFNYTNHSLPIQDHATFYMCTDGITHQTGGPRQFPFGKKRFKRLLLDHCEKSLSEQKRAFEEAIEKYRGDEPQLDDMTLVGFTVS
ncbi:MAG: SpoIIE family protein phosphatase [Desulfomonile tiedjei]|uniref:SpoIIE family protein phosphatase n=1 Tax=Desulfomonile tiedjei TaxID=2358 RepID=A0A9D6V5V4_9BACT|nr:SpoIIE family protein phosphatase [Desulfomonile tiedjei]